MLFISCLRVGAHVRSAAAPAAANAVAVVVRTIHAASLLPVLNLLNNVGDINSVLLTHCLPLT